MVSLIGVEERAETVAFSQGERTRGIGRPLLPRVVQAATTELAFKVAMMEIGCVISIV
jgi:hypothetical protein